MNLMTDFPVEAALATMRADNMNNVVKVGDSVTVKSITAHQTGTHEKLEDIAGMDQADFYFRVNGSIKAANKPAKRVQIAISSIFQAKVLKDGNAITILDHLRDENNETKGLDMTKLVNMTVTSLQPIVETNLAVVDKLGSSIMVQDYDDSGNAITGDDAKVPARFAMVDHVGYPSLRKAADLAKERVNYVESASTGVLTNAKPLRNLVVTMS